MEEKSKCTWELGKNNGKKSPHGKAVDWKRNTKILPTILDAIGNTPLVRINKITKEYGIKCEVLAKCEYFNAGGSVKDRIGKRMIEDAEKSGRIKKGDTLIEPTSGNTGIGLALTSAIKGYKMIITLPEKMSKEKVDVLKALGAEIVRTPTEAAFDSPESHIGVANKINKETKNSHILDQYSNPSNPLAHYDGTAEELLYQCDNKIDYVIIGAGTGGTIAGTARKLKEKLPNITVVGVDPYGSILARPKSLNTGGSSYKVEGIGYDFVPKVLDHSVVDKWIKTNDKESFLMSRKLIRKEGLLCGGSSGTAMSAAMRFCKDLPADKRVVVVLPDSVRNYMTKFLSNEWMIDCGFVDDQDKQELGIEEHKSWWANKKVSDLALNTPVTLKANLSVEACLKILQETGYDQVPVVDDKGTLLGTITTGHLTSQVLNGKATKKTPVKDILYKQFKAVDVSTPLAKLSDFFDIHHFVIATMTQKVFGENGKMESTTSIYGIVTRIDLVNFILQGDK